MSALKSRLCLAFASVLAAALCACGPSVPKDNGAEKPKPKYEVSKEQLAQESVEGKRTTGQTASSSTSSQASQPSQSSSSSGFGIDKKFGSGGSGVGGISKMSSGSAALGGKQSLGGSTLGGIGKKGMQAPETKAAVAPAPAPTPAPAQTAKTDSASAQGSLPPSAGLAGVAPSSDLDAAASYATGEMALKIKKNAETKLKDIQAKREKELKDATNGQ